ncbi:hypothetical protein H5410_057803 [Solanum commersonii]|uniref:Uncharacterized protein n=1 Tax=Solanum commersonii TaxID=4109 RepID=A0A9J5WQS6_SOLCO|nr:hypothetical protein H5410_057803 [Solanum commersonii]
MCLASQSVRSITISSDMSSFNLCSFHTPFVVKSLTSTSSSCAIFPSV